MNHSHPSEKEIQQWAIDNSDCSTEMNSHMESCARCSAEAETYRLLFFKIKQQPAAAFDFDLSGLVLSQLPKNKTRLSLDNLIAGFLLVFSCCCIGIPVYLFRRNILNMFTGIPPFFIYAIIGSTSIIVLIKIGFLYKKFQNQMRFLNFH
jgi:hypothetical protein